MDLRKLLGKLKDSAGESDSSSRREDGVLDIDGPPAAPKAPPPAKFGGLESSQDGTKSSSGIAGLGMQNYYAGAGPSPGPTDSQKGGLVQNEVNDAMYNMRAEQIARIEAIFSEFGPAVCSYMLTQSLMPGGTKRLVGKLDLTSRGREGADLALLATWVTKNGVPAFCKKVGIRHVSSAELPHASRVGVPKIGSAGGEATSWPALGITPEGGHSGPIQKVAMTPVGLGAEEQASINEESTQLQGGKFPFGDLPSTTPPMAPPAPPPKQSDTGPPAAPGGYMFAPKAKKDA